MQQLEKNLNYTFMDKRLLKQAFVHRSYSQDNNERLEYLGDGCLNFIIAEALYHKLPDANEGELSQLRAHLVKEDTLAEIALRLKLNQFLVLSIGEKNNEGEFRPSTLSDCLEALFGALFLDSDFETTRLVILSLYEPYFQTIIEKAKKEAERIKVLQNWKIPEDFDYDSVMQLSTEGKQRLINIKPLTIDQATRISGVNPADIQVLLMALTQRKQA